jgi:hypothetical protein
MPSARRTLERERWEGVGIVVASLDDIDVMCVVADGGPCGAPAAFRALEAPLKSLKGRRFYGTFLAGEYRACVAIQPGDDPAALGLATWRIPGGKFEKRKLMDWQNRLSEIGATFIAMAREFDADESRPSVEFYRSSRELLLFLPVK